MVSILAERSIIVSKEFLQSLKLWIWSFFASTFLASTLSCSYIIMRWTSWYSNKLQSSGTSFNFINFINNFKRYIGNLSLYSVIFLIIMCGIMLKLSIFKLSGSQSILQPNVQTWKLQTRACNFLIIKPLEKATNLIH